MITVMRNRYVKSYPHGEACYDVTLAKALTRPFTTDAHFVQYTSPAKARLNRDSGVTATMHVIVFDVDCSHTHGTQEDTPGGWRARMFCALSALLKDHPGGYWYETRGGGRIVYRLPSASTIASADDAVEWRKDYAISLAYLARKYGIHADAACADWTRLFRLPRATREGNSQPETRWACGDVNNIDALKIEPTSEDLATARASSKAFDIVKQLDYRSNGDSKGLLFHLCRIRGLLIAERKNAYVIKCPRHEQHSCGKVGDGSTMLYPPAAGKTAGAIHCLHAGCSNMSLKDWMSLFSEHEINEARSY